MIPMPWDEYARISSISFNLLTKWNVAASLVYLVRDYGKSPHPFQAIWEHLKPEEISAFRQIASMESISTTMELIENFCAMCYSYVGALDNEPKYFPLLLRDFGRVTKGRYPNAKLNFGLNGVDSFLKGVAGDGDLLRKYLACENLSPDIASNRHKDLMILKRFADENNDWYNKLKHTNCLVPISMEFDVPGEYSALHMLPQNINWKDPMVVLRDRFSPSVFREGFSRVLDDKVSQIRSESVFGALEYLDNVGEALDCLNTIWQPIRAIQHKKIFGQDLSVYRVPSTNGSAKKGLDQ